jgi:hypothetical protein
MPPGEEHDCDEDGQAMLLTIHDVSRRMAQSVVRMLRSLACRKIVIPPRTFHTCGEGQARASLHRLLERRREG